MYKARGNTSGAILERFLKPTTSTMFGHPVYFLDGPGPSIGVSVLYEDLLNSDFDLWIGGKQYVGP